MGILANGTVETTKAIIFVVDRTNIFLKDNALIDKITLFNDHTQIQTCILYVTRRSETSRKLRNFELRQNEGGEYLEPGETLTLENGDAIEAESTDADAVNFVVFGERI